MYTLKSKEPDIEIKGFNSIYYFEFGKDFSHTPEKHDFWEMVYVDSGNIIAITDGIGTHLGQGQIIFHEPNEIHAHISDSKTSNNMLVVSFTCESEAMSYFAKKTFSADKTVRTLFSLFIDEVKNALNKIPDDYNDKSDLDFSGAGFGSYQLLEGYLAELLIKLIRNGDNTNKKLRSNEKTRNVAQNSIYELMVEYLKDNLYQNLTLSDICEHFIMGKTQLYEIFKTNNGQSVMEYYNTQKLTEAKKLLREETYSITQIADMLGFSCIHSFSRAFKREFNVSPTQYKKKVIK